LKINFPGQTTITAEDFSKAIDSLLQSLETKIDAQISFPSSQMRSSFALALARQCFSNPKSFDSTSNKGMNNYEVDSKSINHAIVTFGPWKGIFKSLWENFQNIDTDYYPLTFFHGRTSLDDLIPKVLEERGNYLLVYNSNGGINLLYSYVVQNSLLHKTASLIRKNAVKVKGVRKPAWEYIEKIPTMTKKPKTQKRRYSSITAFINYFKQKKKVISKPVMFGTNYAYFDPKK